jgi:hypothetical protein
MKLFDFVNYFFLLIFLVCAVLQWNDPDPVRWIVVYLAAAFCCFVFAIRRLPVYVPVVTAIVSILWILVLLPFVWGQTIPMDEVFSMIHMYSPGVEELREIGGLLIVTIWMIALAVKTRRFKRPSIR